MPKIPKPPKIPKVVAIVQARMTSSRLPGKVLMDIAGKPMLLRVVERLKQAKLVKEIVLAIPDTKKNDVLAAFAKENNLKFIRGSEEDVLRRYYKAAKDVGADVIVRITADCPLIDPTVVDKVIQSHFKSGADYTSNVIERSFPRGLDVEVFNFSALQKAEKKAQEPYQREHVTPYFLENPELFKLENVRAKGRLRRPEIRLTVDTQEDLKLVQKIYKHFGSEKFFSLAETIDFLDKNPGLTMLNAQIIQKGAKDSDVSLRRAAEQDIDFLYNLRNQPYVYQYSRVARPVNQQEHIDWLGKVIAGKTNKELFIIDYENKSAGQLRLDYLGKEVKVSVSLLREFQGKGIATAAIEIAMRQIKKKRKVKTFLAEVNKKNIASQRLFEKLNFQLKQEKGEWLRYSLSL